MSMIIYMVSSKENPETTETLVFGYLVRLYPAEGQAWDMYVSTDARESRVIDLDAPSGPDGASPYEQ